jgi:hypothetical protein
MLQVVDVPNDLAVNGAAHAVLKLEVHFWHCVLSCEVLVF